MSIGDNIKKMRNSKDWTQRELAEKSGVTRESIGNYERGDRVPPADILNKIVAALNCNYWDLVYPEEERQEFHKNSNKERIIEPINKIAELSNISIKKTYSESKIVDYDLTDEGEKVPIYDGEYFNGIEVTYKNKSFNLTEEEYYKLADRIIDSIATNILAAKEY